MRFQINPADAERRIRSWRPGRTARIVIVAALGLSLFFHIIGAPPLMDWFTRPRIDIEVYRLGAQTWRSGVPLYADGSMPFISTGLWLPFTYPPFAALTFLPFSFVGQVAASIVITAISLISIAVVCAILVRALGIGDDLNRRWIIAATTTIAIWLSPVWMTLGFGQINLVLLALVLIDIVVVPPRWRGILIGLAAAIKLTPLAFVGYFLLIRRWRPATTATITFLATVVIAWAWAPRDSLRYWTSTLFHSDRIGDQAGELNQNINGFWLRLLSASPHVAHLLWATSSAVVTAIAIISIRRLHAVASDRSEAITALMGATIAAVWGILVCPTSWAHHWVWIVPAVAVLGVVAARSTHSAASVTYGMLAVTGLVVFAVGAFQALPQASTRWNLPETAVGNLYLFWGVAFLVCTALLPARLHDRRGQSEKQAGGTNPPQAAGSDRLDEDDADPVPAPG